MNKPIILRSLFDNKILNVLDVFLKNREMQFYLKEIAEQSKVSLTSCFRIVRKLLKLKILKEVKVARFVVYQLNDTPETDFLDEILAEEKNYLDEFVKIIKNTPGIRQIILHGVETKDRANIIVIATGVNSMMFKPVVAEFRENYKFLISTLTLDPEQYTQMTAMGLYPGKKRMLFDKSNNLELNKDSNNINSD